MQQGPLFVHCSGNGEALVKVMQDYLLEMGSLVDRQGLTLFLGADEGSETRVRWLKAAGIPQTTWSLSRS